MTFDEAALQKVREDRVLIDVVPALMWLYGSIDRAIGHYRRYDKTMMRGLLAESGFECQRFKYGTALCAPGWYVSGRFRAQDTKLSGQLRLFTPVGPLLQAVERLVPMVFGISVLVVGRKPILSQ